MLLIIVQIFQVIYSSYIMFLDKKKNMLLNMFISNALCLLVFGIAGLHSAFITTITITIRSFLFMFRDKYKTNFVFYFCLILHIISGVVDFSGFISLLPSITAVISIFILWFGNEQQIRLGLLIPDLIWFIYYIISGIYISAIFNFITIIFKFVSYIKNHKLNKFQMNKVCSKMSRE